jgi:plasmid stabilization system protein ParE
MPDAWSNKEERQYKHIRDSYEDRGVSKDEAEERAARTVNADRDASGRAKDGDGKPTKSELYEQAKRYDIAGRSSMDKGELRRAVAGHKGGASR